MKNKILNLIFSLIAILVLGVNAKPIKRGGIVSIPIISSGFVKNFNPYTTNNMLHGVMFEPLLLFNNITGKTEYRLAESFKYSSDLKTLTLTLRNGLKWSDGMPLSALDVEFSFNMMKKFPLFDNNSIWSKNRLLSVKAIDDHQIIFNLSKADSTLLWDLDSFFILPMHIWREVKDIFSFPNLNPVGSGPMTKVNFVDVQQIELCRNPHYYLVGRPHLDCILFRSYQDFASIQTALIKGEIDWNSHFVADIESVYVGIDRENNHFWYPPNDAINLYVNTQRAPFDDLRVRQALSMAINRQALTEFGVYGYPKANYNVGGIAEYYQTYLNDNLNKKYRYLTAYSTRKAMLLLDKAEIYDQDGDGYRDFQDGSELEFDIEVVRGWTDWIRVVQMICSYFDDIGIKANVKIVDKTIYDNNLRDGNYNMSISWSRASSSPIFVYKDYYHSSRIGKSYRANYGVNAKQIDKLIDSYISTDDEMKQKEIIFKLQEITAKEFPFIPLFSNPTWFQYSTKKIIGWPNEKHPYVQPVWYDGGKRVIILNNLHQK